MGSVVQIPGIGNVQFPAGMSDDEVGAASHRLYTGAGAKQIAANPPGVPRPKLRDAIGMEPSAWGDAESMGPGAVAQGRKSAGQSFSGIHGPTQYDQSGMPGYQRPTASEDASNAATVGATVAAPFTGGESLLTRMGIMGAGAALGSGAGQLARTGTIDPQQTASDLTTRAVVPELAGTAVANAGKITRGLAAGTKEGVYHLPIVGKPLRYGLKAAMQEWSPGPPVERAITRQMVPEYAGEDFGEDALTTSEPRLIQKMGGRPVDAITDRPSGRLVLSPEEVQSETQQMRLAKKMASQRGMQYAAGIRPTNPEIQ